MLDYNLIRPPIPELLWSHALAAGRVLALTVTWRLMRRVTTMYTIYYKPSDRNKPKSLGIHYIQTVGEVQWFSKRIKCKHKIMCLNQHILIVIDVKYYRLKHSVWANSYAEDAHKILNSKKCQELGNLDYLHPLIKKQYCILLFVLENSDKTEKSETILNIFESLVHNNSQPDKGRNVSRDAGCIQATQFVSPR